MKKLGKRSIQPEYSVMHVNFHEFLQKAQHSTSMELAEEFGLSLGHIHQLKKKICR